MLLGKTLIPEWLTQGVKEKALSHMIFAHKLNKCKLNKCKFARQFSKRLISGTRAIGLLETGFIYQCINDLT